VKRPARLLAGILIFAFFVGAAERAADFEEARAQPTRQAPATELVDGKDVYWWSRRSRFNGRQFRQADKDRDARGRTIRRLKRELAIRPSHSLNAIAYASIAYGVSYSMLRRKAYCETGGTFDPYARNTTAVGREHASGLFQFLPSTFASTPYARYSIWDPYANALAAGWMHRVGRGGEWACR
jgi:hypothetical protein